MNQADIPAPTPEDDILPHQERIEYLISQMGLVKPENLNDVQDKALARTNLGLGTAAIHAATDFEAAGSVAAEATARSTAITAAINAIINGADAAHDTFGELQTMIASDETAAAAMLASIAARLVTVSHGSVAGTTRPTSALPVLWVGTVAPTNAVARDLWMDETAVLLKRYSGSAWVADGSGTYVPQAQTTTAASGKKVFAIALGDAVQGSAVGDIGFFVQPTIFNAQTDIVGGFGYNLDPFGNPKVAGEATVGMVVEGHWFDGTTHMSEAYWTFRNTANTNEKRPLYSVVDRTLHQATNIYTARYHSFTYDPGGTAASVEIMRVGPSNLYVYPLAGTDNQFFLNSASGRTSSLSMGAGTTQNAFLLGTIGTSQSYTAISGTTCFRMYKTSGGGAAVTIGGPDDNGAGLTVYNGTSFANNPAIRAVAKSDQSGDTFSVEENNGTRHVRVTAATSTKAASLVVGKAALAVSATDGFIYAPTVAGTPTGTPTAQTGTVPLLVDTTGSKLWAYVGGAWKSAALA